MNGYFEPGYFEPGYFELPPVAIAPGERSFAAASVLRRIDAPQIPRSVTAAPSDRVVRAR